MNSFTLLQRLSLSFLVTTLFAGFAISQQSVWRELSPQDLAAKTPVVEPNADAEALFWEVRIDDSSIDELSLKHYVRVKIFTEKGRERFSKFDVPFTKYSSIKNLQARVIKPDGSVSEVKKEDIFERELIKAGGYKVKAKSFAVPGIDPGVIVEYQYQEKFEGAGAGGMKLVFQRDIPVRTLSYYYKPYSSKEPRFQSFNFSDTKFVKDAKGFWLATRSNIPAFQEEPRMPPEDMVMPWMRLGGLGLTITSFSAFSVNYVEKDARDWQKYWAAVSTENSSIAKFMNEGGGDIKKAAASIVEGAATPDEKLARIYDFCQKQIKNVSFDPAISADLRKQAGEIRPLSDNLKKKLGTRTRIDLLFGALAGAAGFETRIAYAGDRSKIFFDPQMADESLVHMSGIAVKVGEDYKFYSPGRPYLPAGVLEWDEEDSWAILVGEKSFLWRRIPMLAPEESSEKRTGKLKLLDDGTLVGDFTIELTGNLASEYRADYLYETAAKRDEALKNEITSRISSAEVTNISISNLADNLKPVEERFTVRVPGYAQRTGKRLFLQPGFFDYGTTSLFSSNERKYDVYFRYPFSQKDSFTIELPKGFELDSPDKPAPVGDAQKISSLTISMTIDPAANILTYNRNFSFGGGSRILFPVSSYAPLKSLFDAFYKSNTHTMSLKLKS